MTGETNVVNIKWLHGAHGLYRLCDLPQRASIQETSLGTGWWELDQILRFYDGQFIVVTGLAGAGKSTFVQNIIVNLAQIHHMRSFMYVPENEQSVQEKLRKIWGHHQGFDYFAQELCFIQSAESDQYDDAPHDLRWVLRQAEHVVKNNQVKFIVIDPWNEIERAREKGELLTDYIGWCLMMLKNFCRFYGLTMVMIAHPTKAGTAEGRIPTMADIEGSMNWYNKCDNGLIVVREDAKPVCRVISAKVRELGAGKRGECYFDVAENTGIFTPQTGAVSL